MAELSHRLKALSAPAQSGWCRLCQARIGSTCPHVPMTARQRRRRAERETRRTDGGDRR